jgi:hypothetical protein
LERAAIEVADRDFAPGLSFVGISRVKTLNGIAFLSPFSDIRFLRPNESANMGYLQADTIWRQALENWAVDYYGQDLSYYLEAFDDADRLAN